MSFEGSTLVDWAAFSKAREELGAGFARILGYFREDGVKSLAAIEMAARAQNAAAIVLPAHTLKGEARQFGAYPLADLAERIEVIARDCVERREAPEVLEDVVALRPLFTRTLTLLERESGPVTERRPQVGFGRRATPSSGLGGA